MRAAGLVAIAAVGVLGPSSCADTCESVLIFGLDVRMRDAVAGTPVLRETTAIATMPGYADTVTVSGTARFSIIEDQSGTYVLEIRTDGYQPWRSEGIVVWMADDCHVRPATLTVLLMPARQ